MVATSKSAVRRPGRFAPACSVALALLAIPQPVHGQAGSPPAARASQLPLPDRLTSFKMLWSTMAAVDQANRTGNYSVLRDLGTADFQVNNNAASLASIFATLRGQQVDLSDTMLLEPVFEIAPTMINPTVMRMRGRFPLRPQAIGFDLLFGWERGWRLAGIAIRAEPGQR